MKTFPSAFFFLALCAAASAQSEKKPSFEFGFEQRVRNENWNNLLDFNDGADDQRNQIRYRTRAWFKAPLSSTIDFAAGLNQETNQKFNPNLKNNFDEIVFETLYLDIKKLFVKGLSLRVGRQNLMKGEGFLFLEGSPGDGSRSIYVNAVNLAYTRKKASVEEMERWLGPNLNYDTAPVSAALKSVPL